jgi:hypothetical protein
LRGSTARIWEAEGAMGAGFFSGTGAGTDLVGAALRGAGVGAAALGAGFFAGAAFFGAAFAAAGWLALATGFFTLAVLGADFFAAIMRLP